MPELDYTEQHGTESKHTDQGDGDGNCHEQRLRDDRSHRFRIETGQDAELAAP
jgi:hypothetical protein